MQCRKMKLIKNKNSKFIVEKFTEAVVDVKISMIKN